MNIVEPIFLHCRSKPADVALAAPGTALNIVSYGRLRRSVDNVARRIISSGLVPGNRVAVFIADPLLHAIVLIALTRLGIVTISGRNKSFSWRFEVQAVIADSPYQFRAPKIILADPDWTTGNDQPLDSKYIYRAAPDDPCRIFLTSGTTGEEKAIAVTHRMLMERIARQYMHFGTRVSFSSRMFIDLGLSTSLGFQLLIAMLWRGGAMFMPGEPQATVNALPIYNVRSMVAAPGAMLNFLEAIEKRPQYECGFDAIWTGGSALPSALSTRIRTRICANLTFAYGSTEATMVASMPAQFGDGLQGAVGYVFPGIEVDIIDENGVSLPRGETGAVRIRSRYGATEYLDDPEESARVFRDGWFHPGDLGYLTPDNMLVISGRARSVLNVGGEKLSPEKLEEVLAAHPSVAQAAVLAVPNELGMEQVCALIVPRTQLDADALHRHCVLNLPSQLVPARFVEVTQIPRNDAGKIDRDKLRALVNSKLN